MVPQRSRRIVSLDPFPLVVRTVDVGDSRFTHLIIISTGSRSDLHHRLYRRSVLAECRDWPYRSVGDLLGETLSMVHRAISLGWVRESLAPIGQAPPPPERDSETVMGALERECFPLPTGRISGSIRDDQGFGATAPA